MGFAEKISGWAGNLAFNLLVFYLTSSIFLGTFHHHWVVPFFCGLLLFEALLLTHVQRPWVRSALSMHLVWVIGVGVILVWRQRSMFECFRHCEIRLALGLFFLGLTSLLLNRSFNVDWIKRTCTILGIIFFIWFSGVVSFLVLRSHSNLLKSTPKKLYISSSLQPPAPSPPSGPGQWLATDT